MDEASEFRKRLQTCVDKAGSIYALAKKAGLPQNTIRRYFADSEPTRPKLLAIAKASGVSVQWLATGEDQTVDSEAAQKRDEVWIDGLVDRLKLLVAKHGDAGKFCERNGLNILPAVLTNWLEAGHVPPALIEEIAGSYTLPIRWLLGGAASQTVGSADYLSKKLKDDFWHAIDDMDEWRLLNGEVNAEAFQALKSPAWQWRQKIVELFKSVYSKLPPSAYEILKFESFIAHDFVSDGDLVVVDTLQKTPRVGLYAFRMEGLSDTSLHLLRVSEVGGIVRVMEAKGSQYPLPEGEECIGRVLLIVRNYL